MKTRKLFFILIILVGATILITSCEKDETPDPQNLVTENELKAAEDDALADKLFSELTDIANEAMSGKQAALKGTILDTIFIGPCVTVSIDTLAFPHNVTIDFGQENCLCNDGKHRRGKIIVNHNGPYWAEGTVITSTFDNYFVEDHQLLGTKVITNLGLNSSNNPTWTVSVNGQVIKPDGGIITWVGDRMREWVEGHNTPFIWWDDVYHITGTHDVVASNGNTLSAIVTEALEVALNCYWIRSGVIELQHSLLPLMVFDYGDGNCDKQATVTINGVTYDITL